MKRILALALAALLTLNFAACSKKDPAKPVPQPEPFAGKLETLDGIQALASVRHPKILLENIQKLTAEIPEAAIINILLPQLSRYGYPDFNEIADNANCGLVVLPQNFIDGAKPELVLFLKLKPKGKLRRNLFREELGWTLQEHNGWTLITQNAGAIEKIPDPDAVIAILAQPQTEDIRIHAPVTPALTAIIQTALGQAIDKAKMKRADKDALRSYTAVLLETIQQVHSIDYSLTLADNALQLRSKIQFKPDTPLGTATRYPVNKTVADAQYLPADALLSAVLRYEPKALLDLNAHYAEKLTAIQYDLSPILKKIFDTTALYTAANQGAAAMLIDLRLTDNPAQPLEVDLFGTYSTDIDQAAFNKHNTDIYAAIDELIAFIQHKATKRQAAAIPDVKITYTPGTLTQNGIQFAAIETTTAVGNVTTTQKQYAALDKNRYIQAGSEATIAKYLPALLAQKPLENSIAKTLPLTGSQVFRMALNNEKALNLVLTHPKYRAADAETLNAIREEYAAATPVTSDYEASQAAIRSTLEIPYKFIAATVHLIQSAE